VHDSSEIAPWRETTQFRIAPRCQVFPTGRMALHCRSLSCHHSSIRSAAATVDASCYPAPTKQLAAQGQHTSLSVNDADDAQ
jgi:hypothetical protein